MDEYFAAISAGATAGVTNKDGSEVTAEQAMKSMMTTLQFGMKYGLGVGPKGKFIFEGVRHKAMRGESEEDDRYHGDDMKEMLGDDMSTDFYAGS